MHTANALMREQPLKVVSQVCPEKKFAIQIKTDNQIRIP
jgi:hypothetical protein